MYARRIPSKHADAVYLKPFTENGIILVKGL